MMSYYNYNASMKPLMKFQFNGLEKITTNYSQMQ